MLAALNGLAGKPRRDVQSGVGAGLACCLLAGCGLEPRPFEAIKREIGATAPDPAAPAEAQAQTQASAEATGPQNYLASPGPNLLPEPDMLAAISRRAVRDATHTYRGFLPSIAAVSACYEALAEHDVVMRAYCLQLDQAAWFVESTAPALWQELDAAANDYFTDERFLERRWRQTPPLKDTLEAHDLRRANIRVLEEAMMAALAEYVEAIAPGAGDRPTLPDKLPPKTQMMAQQVEEARL